jgi:hypothetical protein
MWDINTVAAVSYRGKKNVGVSNRDLIVII